MNTHPLSHRLEPLPTHIWAKIAQIDEFKGHWRAGVQLHPQVLGRLKRSVLVTSTGASTRIEGAMLSDEDIERMLRGLSIQHFSDRDKQEVQGYYELLTNVFDAWQDLRFSESLIKHFHRELLKYVEKDERHRGEYKKQENKVQMVDEAGHSVGVLFDTTPAYLTPVEMQTLTEWTVQAFQERSHHPLLIIAGFVVQFLQIHPFQDGNGRLSRILTNLLLLQAGYTYMPYTSHEKLIEDNKPDYYMALRRSQTSFQTDQETILPWLEFFLDVVHRQAQLAINLVSAQGVEKLLSPTQLKVWEYMQTVDEAAPRTLSQALDIPRSTINQVANKLMDLGKIERIGLGRATRYRVIRL